MRTPDVFVYREDKQLDQQMRPVYTQFMADANLTKLKTTLDQIQVSVTRPALLDRMEAAYQADDSVRRLELGLATGGATGLESLVDRLNRAVVEDLQRSALAGGAQMYHDQFLSRAGALLGDDLRGIYTYYDTPQQERVRIYARGAAQLDMNRWM